MRPTSKRATSRSAACKASVSTILTADDKARVTIVIVMALHGYFLLLEVHGYFILPEEHGYF